MLKFNSKHGFHLVNPSPWPFFSSVGAFMLTFGTVMYMHGYSYFVMVCGYSVLLFTMFFWWDDVIREGTYEGRHTLVVQNGLKAGMLLFIVSEIMFFFAFFWAFFHSSFNPSPFIGGVWPPFSMVVLDTWKIPLLNTVLLLTSGATITWAHHSIVWGSKVQSVIAVTLTVTIAFIFTLFQIFEYFSAPFSLSDSVYGSTFYLATGFHGFHVFIGTCFLFVCLLRLINNEFTQEHHVGFEAAAWYWHFVDVVWLFLFLTVYWWGS